MIPLGVLYFVHPCIRHLQGLHDLKGGLQAGGIVATAGGHGIGKPGRFVVVCQVVVDLSDDLIRVAAAEDHGEELITTETGGQGILGNGIFQGSCYGGYGPVTICMDTKNKE